VAYSKSKEGRENNHAIIGVTHNGGRKPSGTSPEGAGDPRRGEKGRNCLGMGGAKEREVCIYFSRAQVSFGVRGKGQMRE